MNLVRAAWALTLTLLALSPLAACAGEVIANAGVLLSADEIRDVFLGEKQFAGSLKLIPVDNGSLRGEFLAKVLQTDERKYAARWTRKSFREGMAAPAIKGSDAEVIAFVRSTPGAVGYVSAGAPGVKVLEKF
jgi:ABC-type phosphate transport system substrate-binding protein